MAWRIVFVCTGNICRSPTAEAVLRKMAAAQGQAGRVEVASAGLEGWHAGAPPDGRSQAHAQRRGYELATLRARHFTRLDFERFDWVIAMDAGHHDRLRRLCPPRRRFVGGRGGVLDDSSKLSFVCNERPAALAGNVGDDRQLPGTIKLDDSFPTMIPIDRLSSPDPLATIAKSTESGCSTAANPLRQSALGRIRRRSIPAAAFQQALSFSQSPGGELVGKSLAERHLQ